jgi:hypothetical protein
LKEEIFICPQIREIMQDADFHSSLSDIEKKTWNAFKSASSDVGVNHKAKNYKKIISEMLKCFQVMKCNMSLKLHFSDSSVGFPLKLGKIYR